MQRTPLKVLSVGTGLALAAGTGAATYAASETTIVRQVTEAGLTAGDVIAGVDGESVSSAEELQEAIDERQPGDSIALAYVRDGERNTVELQLAARPA